MKRSLKIANKQQKELMKMSNNNNFKSSFEGAVKILKNMNAKKLQRFEFFFQWNLDHAKSTYDQKLYLFY